MKSSRLAFVGVVMVLLSGCSTAPKENVQQAYEASLTDGQVMMATLRTLESGDVRKAKQIVMTSLEVTLSSLGSLAGQAHPTPEQKQEEIAFARDVLEYMLAHREEINPRLPSVRAGVRGLQKMLTQAEDIPRVSELSEYLAAVEKKMSETTMP